MEDKIIEKYIKMFELIKIKEINHVGNKAYFTFHDKSQICLGTIIDGMPILLDSNTIIPYFTQSADTKLDTYYVFETYDYGTNIPIVDGTITLLEKPEILRKKYREVVDWYQSEVVEKEKKNIKSFEKEVAKLSEK